MNALKIEFLELQFLDFIWLIQALYLALNLKKQKLLFKSTRLFKTSIRFYWGSGDCLTSF